MAKKHGRGRGISASTIVMLSLTAVILLVGAGMFSRISGDISQISIDPKMLAEPVNAFTRSVINTEPENPSGGAGGGNAPDAPVEVFATAAPTATVSATPEPTQPPNRRLSLTAVGQIFIGAELRKSATSESGAFYFDPIFDLVRPALSGADLSIATLRTNLTDDKNAYDAFNAPYELAVSLGNAGVNMINLSTDRVVDFGVAGLGKTLDLLRQNSLTAQGAYATAEARQALPISEVNGIKVGIVSYTNSISSAGKKAASEAEIQTATRVLMVDAAKADIAALKNAGAELVIVLAHWGGRTDAKPTNEMRTTADALANAGADIILGTNPAFVQEAELRTITDDSGKTRDVFIAYSLGNFLIDESRDTGAITGLILNITIDWNTQTQRATYSEGWYMPTWIMRYKDDGGANSYRIVPAGTANIPQGMTESIYANMKKSYQNIVNKLDTSFMQPKTEP